mmetsp:Transcript_20891/g.34458  ORF Transcript_20891/g.34458 Transcript_20891/m.34458 type:complete len:441 (-) Transcript_20891:239-1561(-)
MRDQAMAGMVMAGKQVGIDFDYNVFINRQPIDSQRVLLYAARQGKQEAYVSALSKRHFTQGSKGESASKRHTIVAAAEEAGLDRDEVLTFLDTDELRDYVWKSYGEMPRRGIQAIPLFVFNVPELGIEGGPLRPHAAGDPPIVNGSMQVHTFTLIFEDLWKRIVKHRKARALKTPKRDPTCTPKPPAAPAASLSPLLARALELAELAETKDVVAEVTPPPKVAAAAPEAAKEDVAEVSGSSSELLAELKRRGADVASLLQLAANADATPLHAALKALGFSRMGDRVRVGSSLLEISTGRTAGYPNPLMGDEVAIEKAEQLDTRNGGAASVAAALVGKKVVLQRLNARAELNGRLGSCKRYDVDSGRCAVRVLDSKETLLVKPLNLRLAQATDLRAEAKARAEKVDAQSKSAVEATVEAKAKAEPLLNSGMLEEDDDICMM